LVSANESRHALGEACLAKVKHEDPQVEAKLDRLFSLGKQISTAYIAEVLSRIITSFILAQQRQVLDTLGIRDHCQKNAQVVTGTVKMDVRAVCLAKDGQDPVVIELLGV